MKKGFVSLVGAGPGDRGLLTIKGKERIQNADVVIYDRLVSPEVMALVPQQSEKINVGKKMSCHPVPQEKINEIILEKALEGKKVVRLKGGDSFLFGRGAEELELLIENGVDYEVVPGITSAFSVPTYAGIPVTHRDLTSSVHVITGHAKAGKKIDINYDALVGHKGTLVFLMGLTALGELMDGLMQAGMDENMPAATIEKGTTSFQRKIVGTVGTILKKVREAKIESPAITIVGKVANLSHDMDWYTIKPLIGKTILVTRPKEKSGQLADRLREYGAKVVEFPCIETVKVSDNYIFEETLKKSNEFGYIVFTSPSGVETFFEKLSECKIDIRNLYGMKIAAVGQQTKKLIEEKCLVVDFMPEVYDSIHLAKGLIEELSTAKGVLLVRGNLATDLLPQTLDQNNIKYKELVVYETRYNNPIEDFVESDMDKIDFAVFSSASTVEGFTQVIKTDYSKINAVCIGKMTAKAAEKHNMNIEISEKATIDSLIEKIIEIVERG